LNFGKSKSSNRAGPARQRPFRPRAARFQTAAVVACHRPPFPATISTRAWAGRGLPPHFASSHCSHSLLCSALARALPCFAPLHCRRLCSTWTPPTATHHRRPSWKIGPPSSARCVIASSSSSRRPMTSSASFTSPLASSARARQRWPPPILLRLS
jgi:hypothetical protein